MDLSFYFSLFMRRFHWFLAMVVLCASIGFTVARILPTTYEAEALLVVESEQIPGELAASTVQTQAKEQLQIIRQRILTRDTLLELANRFEIYKDQETIRSADEIVPDLRSRISIAIEGTSPSARRGEPQATLVRVSFQAPSARQVALVTNELVTLILDEDVSMRTSVARQTLEFFEQEVQRLDQELAQRSAAILEFKERNLSALPDSLEFRRSQQAVTQERVLQIERELNVLRERVGTLRDFKATEGAAAAAQVPEELMTSDERALQGLKDERAGLLAILSPENPKVKLLDSRIAALEATVTSHQATLEVSGQSAGSANPVERPTSLDFQIADLETQISNLVEQQAQLDTELEALNTSIAATPGNTIAIETMERDYEALRSRYDQAVANRAKAVTGDTIEALSKGQRISVIEQAVIPEQPVSPNRPLIAIGGLGGGIFLGIVLVALIELLKPGIRRPADLVNGLGITPFATLPYTRTKEEITKRRLTIVLVIFLVAAIGVGGLWVVDQYYISLNQILESIAQRLG